MGRCGGEAGGRALVALRVAGVAVAEVAVAEADLERSAAAVEDLVVAEAGAGGLGLDLMLLTLLPKRTHAGLQGWSIPHTVGRGMPLSHTLRSQPTGRARWCR